MSDSYTDVLDQVSPEPIKLVDHTTSGGADSSLLKLSDPVSGIWAKDVHIDHYQIIQGTSKAGAYVVYLIRIETYIGDAIKINRRYSDFDAFRAALVGQFGSRVNEIPQLPPKSFVSRFRPSFLNHRQSKLQYFLLCILLNPVFATSKVVKDFVKYSA